MLLRIGLSRVDMILPVSKALQQEMESYGIKNPFTVIPNTVNTNRFAPSVRDNDKTKRILTVGGITRIKGVYYLIQAIAKVKNKRDDFVLDIVGEGPLRKEYEQLSQTLGLDKLIIFHGLKTQTQVAEFMRQSDFVVIPSLWESFSCPLIQALACGKPVIASNVGGIKEILNSKLGMLVLSEDVDALAGAIGTMLDEYSSYDSLILSKYAKENFGYEAVGKKLDSIYREIKKRADDL